MKAAVLKNYCHSVLLKKLPAFNSFLFPYFVKAMVIFLLKAQSQLSHYILVVG